MRKSEIFNKVLDVVAAETEVSQACILSRCKRHEVVDARHMLCHFLLQKGMPLPVVAEKMGCTLRNVEKIREQFENRQKQGGKVFKFVFERIANLLRSSFEQAD